MYSKTTNGVTVTVTPYFLDDQSSPQESHYVWAYQVNIKNTSSLPELHTLKIGSSALHPNKNLMESP